jgi:hypothetical protein
MEYGTYQTFSKSNKNSPVLQQMLKNVVLLTECSQYTSGARYLLSEVLALKLLARAMHLSYTKHLFFPHQVGVSE